MTRVLSPTSTQPNASVTGLRPPRRVWIVYGCLGLFAAFYLVYLIAQRHSPYSSLVDGWSVDVMETIASGMCLARGLVRRPGRAVALTLGLGLLAWTAGDVALTVESLGGATAAVPSVADAFYVAFYPLTYVAVVLFMRGQLRRLTTPSWLDGAVAGLGAAAVLAAFAFHSILRLTGGGSLSVAIGLAYPVGDLLLLALIVGATALLSGQRKTPWLLLAGGILLTVLGDTGGLLSASTGTVGAVADGIGWPTAIVLMSMAVWVRPRPSNPLVQQKPTGFVLPGLALVAGLTVLVVGTVAHPGRVAVVLATATLLLAGVRLALSVAGLRALTHQRLRQSLTDELTGLGNRRYLFQVLDGFFAEQADPEMPSRNLAFLFIDLDRFKEINDSYGHPAGDELLRQLGPRLSGALRSTDALVRIGGDEFGVVMIDADVEATIALAQRLTTVLEEPFSLDVVAAQIGASIGIALAPNDAIDSAGLMWSADIAMYRAKTSGTPFALYERELDNNGHRWGLIDDLRAALVRQEFVLHYQPQLDLNSGQILAVEALVRWQHPQLGLVPPLDFLPLAEEAGLMGEVTAWVLSHALEQCATWRAAGRRMVVAVNISATNLLDANLIHLVSSLLSRHDLPADSLVIEITETSVIRDFERSRSVIEELRDLGINVSIDDFGAGFTSLAHLGSLAVRELKLDRIFITGLGTGQQGDRGLQLVKATIELAHAMGLRVVAEGIEDEETLRVLTELHCDVAQGYFISKPKPAHELAFRPTGGIESTAAPHGSEARAAV
jgi:diguanylate cyclase (GGDEF)-like protein